MKTVILGLTLAAVVAAVPRAQVSRRPPTASADGVTIEGRVVTDGTSEPIRNARVTLSSASQEMPVVLTDAGGAFRLTAPPGRYTVVASKTGYARADVILAGSGQPVEMRLKKGAAIVGRVVDDRGDPVVGVQVAALRQGAGDKPTTVATSDTDDRGEYRLAGLPDAALVVGVTTLGAIGPLVNPSGNRADPRTTYYPATAVLDEAQVLHLQPGEERPGADIVIPADRLAGTPDALFANRFRPRTESPRLQGLPKPAPRPAGSVRGRVVDVDGTPIPIARVYLFTGTNPESKMSTTDDAGRFEVGEIVAGALLISTARAGYVQIESGQALESFPVGRAVTSPAPDDVRFGRRVELAANERKNVDLQMARLSTLSGAITDEYGDPMEGVGVEVLQVRYEGGRRWLMPAGPARLTDDRGRYRLYGLLPGQYVVSAAIGQVTSDDLPGYGRAYFPGTPNAGNAQYVTVGFAQDLASVDFSMSRVRTARVSGIVLSPTGERSMPGALTLTPSQSSSSATNVAVGARIGPDGRFVFPNVSPGEYVIHAYRGRLNAHAEGEFGAASISVDGAEVTGVTVRTSSGSSVRGRFSFDVDDPRAAPKPSDFELAAIPADFDASPPNNPASADIHGDWTFDMSGLNGPRRLELVRTPPGYAVEQIRANGTDVTDRPVPFGTRAQSLTNIEVVLTDRVNELSGTVADERGRPAVGAAIVVFSTDRQQWYPVSRYLRRSSANQDGAFRVTGLPSGSYFASAVSAIPAGGADAWQDPQFLETLIPGASTFIAGEGQKAVLTLRIRSR